MLASIPSPPISEISVGPLEIHIYGILMGIAVLVAAITITRRYKAWRGDASILEKVIIWTVVIGFLGARLAYVSTHLDRFEGRWYAVFFIWEGGLALFGGLTAGAITAVVLLRRYGGDPWVFADAAAIGLPLAQAIGRFGNYFNQELFGTPSDLPWAVEIDVQNRPPQYVEFETFHPTFLYEALWNVAVLVPIVLWLERRGKLAKGSSIGLYMVLYGTIRYFTELIRTDTTFRFLEISRNGWVAFFVVIAGAVLIVWRQRRGEPQGISPKHEAEDAGEAEDAASPTTTT